MPPDPAAKHLDYHDAGRVTVAMDVDYPDGASTGWHTHPRAQLLHAIEGVMTVRSEQGTWVVPPSRALWLVAGMEHEVRMSGTVRIRTVFIDAAAIDHPPTQTCVVSVSPLLRELIVAAVTIPLDYPDHGRDARLMHLLVDEIREADVLPLHLPMPDEPRVRRICDRLVTEPANGCTADQWARQSGVTARTVHRLFVRETGMTFAQWRDQARLIFALRRLAQGERVIDVAFDCGYASQSAFAAMFRRHFGKPPSEFYR